MKQKGFTLVELLAVVVIIGLLAGLAGLGLSKAVDKAHSTECLSHLRQLGQALQLYAVDHNNYYPAITDPSTKTDWDRGAIAPYLPTRPDGRANTIFICPSANYKGVTNGDITRAYSSTECQIGIDPSTGNVAFTWGYSRNNSIITSPSHTLLMFDACQSGSLRYSSLLTTWTQLSQSNDLNPTAQTTSYIDFRHDGLAHFLYADGHVGGISHAEASSAITQLYWKGK